MTRGVQRLAAAAAGLLLALLLARAGTPWLGLVGGLMHAGSMFETWLPQTLRRVLAPATLAITTALTVWGVILLDAAAWGVCTVSAALLSWNATLFLQRWPDAPRASQLLYLRSVAAVGVLGLAGGLSALALQGRIKVPFGAAFLMMLASAVSLLRVVASGLERSSTDDERPAGQPPAPHTPFSR